MFVEVNIVVALEELIGKLGERHTLASFAVEALLYRVFSHHIVDGDEFTYLACEIKEGVILHPVVVVDEFRCVFAFAEVEEALQLLLDALLVVAECSFV